MSLGKSKIHFCKNCGKLTEKKEGNRGYFLYCNDSCRSAYYQKLRGKELTEKIRENPNKFVREMMESIQQPMDRITPKYLDKIEIMRVIKPTQQLLQLNVRHNKLFQKLGVKTDDVVRIIIEVVYRNKK